MAKLPRVFQKIFGSAAPSSGLGAIGQIGSLAAGTPTDTTDLTVIQALAEYLEGWKGIVVGNNSPAMEDFNGCFFLVTTQLAYLFQAGVSEWDSSTAYYTGSLVNSAGVLYMSLLDNNVGNALTDTTNWKILNRGMRTVAIDDSATVADDIIYLNPGVTEITETLPLVADSIGKLFIVKNIATTGASAILKGNGSELIDSVNTLRLPPGAVAQVVSTGSVWRVTSLTMPGISLSVYRSVAANSATGVMTPIPFNTVKFAAGLSINVGTGEVTCSYAGKYRVACFMTYTPLAAGSWGAGNVVQLAILKNGSVWNYLDEYRAQTANAFDASVVGTDIVNCAVGDTLQFAIFQNSGGTGATGTNTQCWASVSYEGP